MSNKNRDIQSKRKKVVLIGIMSKGSQNGKTYKYITNKGKEVDAQVASIAALKAVIKDRYEENTATDIDVHYLCSEQAKSDGILELSENYVASIDSEHIKIYHTDCGDDFSEDDIVLFMRNIVDKTVKKDEVYVDYTAGQRTSSLYMMMIMRILQAKGIKIKSVMYSIIPNPKQEEAKGAIEDAGNTYRMFDVISGVDEFVKHGSATALKKYFGRYQGANADSYRKISNAINRLSEMLIICQLNGIMDAIVSLKDELYKAHSYQNNTSFETIILNMISEDISRILISEGENTGKVDLVKLIKWCMGKNLIQPALALATEFLPIFAVEQGFFKPKDDAYILADINKDSKSWDGHKSTDYRTACFARHNPNKGRYFIVEGKDYITFENPYRKLKKKRNDVSHVNATELNLEDFKNTLSDLYDVFEGDLCFSSKKIETVAKRFLKIETKKEVHKFSKEKVVVKITQKRDNGTWLCEIQGDKATEFKDMAISVNKNSVKGKDFADYKDKEYYAVFTTENKKEKYAVVRLLKK